MNHLLSENSTLINALGWTLLHSIWQGLMLFCILKITLKIIPTSKARLRYNISLAVLSSLVIWTVITFVEQWKRFNDIIYAKNILANIDQATIIQGNNKTIAATDISFLEAARYWVNEHTTAIVLVYIAGITILLVRMAFNLLVLKKIKRSGKYSTNKLWNNILSKQLDQLNISKQVSLLLSEKVDTTVVIGAIKPVIIFPFAAASHLTNEQFEAILIHELAHIKRNDYLINMAQVIIETFLFYNPFVWLVSNIIRTEREHCCDDVVTGNEANKIPYANALAQLATTAQNINQPAIAATGNKHQLLNRIKRIIEMKHTPITRTQITAVIVLTITLILSITLITPDLTAKTKDDDKKEQHDDDKKKKKKKKSSKAKVIQMYSEEVTIIDEDGEKRHYSKLEDIPQEDRERLDKSLGKNTLVIYGPNKKTIIKSGGKYKVESLHADDDIEIEVEELSDEIEDAVGESITVAMKAIGSIDWDSIGTTIEKAVEAIDWDNMAVEIKEALKDIDTAELKEARKDIAKAKIQYRLAMRNARQQVAHAQKVMREAHIEEVKEAKRRHKEVIIKHKIAMKEHHEAMDKHKASMAKHHEAMKKHDKAMVKHNKFNSMLDMMDKDGLINKDKKYIIEKKGKRSLYIDGIKQSNEVYKKYEEYLQADEITIKGSKNSLSIKIEED